MYIRSTFVRIKVKDHTICFIVEMLDSFCYPILPVEEITRITIILFKENFRFLENSNVIVKMQNQTFLIYLIEYT